jgi:trimeric autotransporter adhesin
MNPLIQLRTTPPLLITLAFLCFGLLPGAQAVVPPPDGGYPGFNTAEGTNALFSLTTGSANTAVGWSSLLTNAAGSFNTATGAGSLLFNTADQNTAFGTAALLFNTIGSNNTALGTAALLNNTEGSFNTANGFIALSSNTDGADNTATGARTLFTNTTGSSNTATGVGSLSSNTTGGNNTATGSNALITNTAGSFNTAIGFAALFANTQGIGNTGIGDSALSQATGDGNIGVGAAAGTQVTTASNAICIGTPGANQSDSCYIGNIFAREVAIGGIPVLVDSLGKLGTQISSRRFKKDIQAMDKASETILALKPVSFRYKSDGSRTPCFGLIAEEVAEVNPDLVVRDEKGEPLTVRYDQVNAMLLNEFLKEYRKVEDQNSKIQQQEATIADLKSRVAQQQKDFQATAAQQQKQIEALTAGLHKVSAQLEASKPAPQVVTNP